MSFGCLPVWALDRQTDRESGRDSKRMPGVSQSACLRDAVLKLHLTRWLLLVALCLGRQVQLVPLRGKVPLGGIVER